MLLFLWLSLEHVFPLLEISNFTSCLSELWTMWNESILQLRRREYKRVEVKLAIQFVIM